MSNQKSIVHLRVYKPNGNSNVIGYDAEGNVLNENVLVKLTHETKEWDNYLANIRVNGFIKAKVEKVLKKTKEGYSEVKNTKKIEEEVSKAIGIETKEESKLISSEEFKKLQEENAELKQKLEGINNQQS